MLGTDKDSEDDPAKENLLQALRCCLRLLCGVRHVRNVSPAFIFIWGSRARDNPPEKTVVNCARGGDSPKH